MPNIDQSIDQSTDNSEQFAKLVVHILSCLAAFEREKYHEEVAAEPSQRMEVDGEEEVLCACLHATLCGVTAPIRMAISSPQLQLAATNTCAFF